VALGRGKSANRRDYDRAEGKGLPGTKGHPENFDSRREPRDNPSGGRVCPGSAQAAGSQVWRLRTNARCDPTTCP
jgi:hypothetical protein